MESGANELTAADARRRQEMFIVDIGRSLHRCGATAGRVERHLCNLSRLLGLHGDFLITPTSFTCAFWLDDRADQRIHLERIQPGGTDLGRLWQIDDLVDRLEAGGIDLQEGERALAEILAGPGFYRPWQMAIAWMVIGGAFSALLSASSQDAVVSAGLSLLIFLLTYRVAKIPRFTGLIEIAAPCLAAIGASVAAACGAVINVPFVILSAVIIFVPGLALTTALSEISSRNLISGTSRLVDAVMILFKLTFGAALGLSIAALLGAGPMVHAAVADLPPYRTAFALLFLSLGLTVDLNIPARRSWWGLAAAAIAYFTAAFAEGRFGMVAGLFLGALAVGIFANLFSRLGKGPAIIPLTQGIVLLVPGSRIYIILNAWITGEAIVPGVNNATHAFMTFLALIAGLLFANAVVPTNKSL